jgi:pimeloyl-ACP methyl ester carboxylesterase
VTARASIAGHALEIDRVPGSSPTLVFLHEGLGSVARWRDFPRAVAAATGHAAVVYSRRGYGASEPRPPPWPVDFMHDEALRVLPALLAAEGIDDAVLIGHSDGASIALVYAGAVGRGIRGVAVMAPHTFVEDVCTRAIAALSAQFDDASTGVRERLGRGHADVDGAFHGWSSAWLHPDFRRWDLRSYLPGVRVPVLAIQGEDDEYGTLAQVDAVCGGVSGRSDRLVLPGCGHVPQKDRREETLAALCAFVRGLSSAPREA